MKREKNVNHDELDKAFQHFELTVKDPFISPAKISFNRMRDAYYNLNKGRLQENYKAMKYSDNSTENKSKENLTDKDKANNELTKEVLKGAGLREKSISDNNSKKKNKSADEKVLNFVKFGQRKDFSFFESYAREIIFQLFNYHKMFFYKYDLEKILQKESNKAKFSRNNKSENPGPKNDGGKTQGFSCGNMGRVDDDEIATGDEKRQNNEKEQLKKEICKNKNNTINNKKSNINDEKKENEDKSKIIEKEDYNKNEEKTITQKDKNIKLKGDFDFILPNVTKSELATVLNNKTISPFIFFSNIKISDNYDIIGEVKEAIDDYHKNISQLTKYIKLFDLLEKNEKINNVFGLKKENKKILFYVFNSTYKSFIFKMIEHTINYNKFKEIDKKYINEYYNNIIHYYQPPDKKDNLIDLLVKSNIPYICIYLPNPVFKAETDTKLSPTK